MRKVFVFFAVVACFMLWVLPVRADVIWEPYDDDFYMEHRDECEYINRVYAADGPEDKVIVYKSPENPTVVETWENGRNARIYYIWRDENGNSWGIYEDYENDKTGWMPMEYMDVVYDYICFEEEFGESIVEETVSIPGEYVKKSIFCWSYPGAETYVEIPMPEYEADMPQCHKTYVDEAGRKWGYIGYFRGTRNKWVCLDNPVADAVALFPDGLPEREVQEVEETDAPADTERIAPAGNNGIIGLIVCLVIGVTGATGGALVKLKKSRK